MGWGSMKTKVALLRKEANRGFAFHLTHHTPPTWIQVPYLELCLLLNVRKKKWEGIASQQPAEENSSTLLRRQEAKKPSGPLALVILIQISPRMQL